MHLFDVEAGVHPPFRKKLCVVSDPDDLIYYLSCVISTVLPPYQFTCVLHISRRKFDYKFSQQNMRHVAQKLYH
jgi:hypothetical protein